jgi:hypothetical protein
VRRRDGVNEAVGPDIRGRVVEDGQARVGRVVDEERREVEVDLGHALQGVVELRHDRGDGYACDGLEVEAGDGEEVAHLQPVLVARPRALRRQTPVPREPLALEHAERRVRVPHIHHQKHAVLTSQDFFQSVGGGSRAVLGAHAAACLGGA